MKSKDKASEIARRIEKLNENNKYPIMLACEMLGHPTWAVDCWPASKRVFCSHTLQAMCKLTEELDCTYYITTKLTCGKQMVPVFRFFAF